MNAERSFGDWLRQRRRVLDLTQDELARQVGCSAITLRKLEAEERRPSKQIAERLAEVLQVASEDRPAFLRFARGDPFAAPSAAIAESVKHGSETPARLHNLPIQLTSFVGREKEMGEVRQLLGGRDDPVGRLPAGGDVPPERLYHRLVTLTGTGGTGKTRLALQVAADLLAWFPDGVWLVELASLADSALVPQTVATVLGVQEQASRPILATLTDYLRGKKALLVLDNCEHLIQASAQFAEAVLQACPDLCILASSREMLGVAGERSFYVPSLSTPEPRAALPVDTLIGYDAVRLFVERAVAVLPQFVLTGDNALAVAQVCRQLDGIPLAIELAAARVKLLQVEQIAERLDDRFQLLTGGSRTALPRHQTLAALIDWSYDLLSEPERTLLRRLSVFAGGWTLEAVEAVCNDKDEGTLREQKDEFHPSSFLLQPFEVLDLLTQLVNKSLVIAERKQGEEARYRMLETIRQYVLEKLTASGEADAVRRQHAAYYLALADATRSSDLEQFVRLERIAMEHDNLRAALAWSKSVTSGAELGLHLALGLVWFWSLDGYWSEGRNWLEGALAHVNAEGVDDPPTRARVLFNLGNLLTFQGDYIAAQSRFAQSLQLFRALGDRRWIAFTIERLGWLAREQGDTATARARLEEALALARDLEDNTLTCQVTNSLAEAMVMQGDIAPAKDLLEENLAWARKVDEREGIPWALNHLGHIAQIQGDHERAMRLHAESLPLFRTIGGKWMGVVEALQCLGETALAQGDAALAGAHLTESLVLSQELGERACMAWCLASLAGVAVLDEEPERAARLWGTAEALRQSIGAREAPAARATHQRLIAAAREQLGEAVFAAAWAEGQAASPEQAIAYALGE